MSTHEAPVIPDVNEAIAAMEQQFPPVHESEIHNYPTVVAIGAVAIDGVSDNWVAVGRARIAGNAYQDRRSLGGAILDDVTAKAEAAGFSNYTLQSVRQQAELRQFMEDRDEEDKKSKKKKRNELLTAA